jgi:DNA-binding CsgD family transcriptional regulator
VAEEIFGRDQELARLSAFIEAIPHGPRALVIEGAAGIGKSTLWRWAIDRASSTSRHVVSCRPGERESNLSYAALGDLLGSTDEAVISSLPLPQRRAVAAALLREDEGDPTIDPRALAYAFLTILKLHARSGPVLVAIDDAQWLDGPTLRVVSFALRRLESEPIGVLEMLRSTESAKEPFGLDRFLPSDKLDRLRLDSLTLGAVHRIVRSRLGANFHRFVLLQLHHVSAGNPFFALEIARFLQTRGIDFEPGQPLPVPDNLIGSVEARLARLPQRIQDVLLAVAASSQPTVAIVTAVAQHPDLVVSDLARATEAGIIEMAGERIRFTHPLLAAAHYSAVSDNRRTAVHMRLAAVVTDAEEKGWHLAHAATGPDSAIASALERAAVFARARGAPEVAARLAEHARRLTPSIQIEDFWRRTNEAAMCHQLSGQSVWARPLWKEIVADAPPGPLRAFARWRLVEYRDSTVDTKERLEECMAALREAGADVSLRAAIHHTIASTLTWAGDLHLASEHASAALSLADEARDPVVLALALPTASWVEFLSGRGIPTDLIQRALALEDDVRHLPLESNPRLNWWAMLATVGEEVEIIRSEFASLRRLAEDSGIEVSLPHLLYVMSEFECRAGDWERAGRYADECYEIASRTTLEFRLPLGLYTQATVAALRGQTDVARAKAEEALVRAGRTGPWYTEARIRGVLAFTELSLGNPQAAHQWLGPVLERERTGGYSEATFLYCSPDEIESLIAMGDLAAAEAHLEALEEQALRLKRSWVRATAARCRGQLAAARSDLPKALSALDEALVAHDRLLNPFELGRTLLVAGIVRRRARQKRSAREALERAAAIFTDLGAAIWAARAREELLRVGAHLAGPDQLSPTERRIAVLVGKGRTNKEIAEALYVSVKSVEANLTRIYQKLGLRSRTELAVQYARDLAGASA